MFKHKISNISSSSNKIEAYDIVGPICESTDTFAKDYEMVKSKRGDFVVIYSCGAYAESMSSNYNLRPKPSEIMIHNKSIKVILKRQKLINII